MQMLAGPVRVGVLVDWERAARTNAWTDLLKSSQDRVRTEVRSYAIADLIVEPQKDGNAGAGLNSIDDKDVLIVNWDAANGDPEFGAHLTLNWLANRQSEILTWVHKGGILVIESQTVFGAPCSEAYDALVGAEELPTSGLSDPATPAGARDRVGDCCKKTKYFPRSNGFELVGKVSASHGLRFEDLFPKTGRAILAMEFDNLDWTTILYRGWFRRTFSFTKKFTWVSLLVTAGQGHKWPFRHTTMKVAKIGDGAIFASTMMIAASKQTNLAVAILRCANGKTGHLPTGTAYLEIARKYWVLITSVFAGLLAGAQLKYLGELNIISSIHEQANGSDPLKYILSLFDVMAAGALFAIIVSGTRYFYRFILNIIGY